MNIEQEEISNLELGIYYVFIAEDENPKAILKDLKQRFWKGIYKFKVQKTSNPELVHSVACVRTDLNMYDDYGIIVVQHNRPVKESVHMPIPDLNTAIHLAHNLKDKITETTPITIYYALRKPKPKPEGIVEKVIVRNRRKFVLGEKYEVEKEENSRGHFLRKHKHSHRKSLLQIHHYRRQSPICRQTKKTSLQLPHTTHNRAFSQPL